MMKRILTLIAFILVLTGCGEYSDFRQSIHSRVYTGIQSDYDHQRLHVFNDTESFDAFFQSLTSYEGPSPNFDSNTETMVVLVAKLDSCQEFPVISGVDVIDGYSDRTAMVIVDKKDDTSGLCDESIEYNLNFAAIPKTKLFVSIEMNSDNLDIFDYTYGPLTVDSIHHGIGLESNEQFMMVANTADQWLQLLAFIPETNHLDFDYDPISQTAVLKTLYFEECYGLPNVVVANQFINRTTFEKTISIEGLFSIYELGNVDLCEDSVHQNRFYLAIMEKHELPVSYINYLDDNYY